MNVTIVGALTLVLAAVGLTGCASVSPETAAPPAPTNLLPSVVKSCGLDSTYVLGDGGKSAEIDSGNTWSGGKSVPKVLGCLLRGLGAPTPDALSEQMQGTRPVDGQQSSSWGNYKAVWTVGPVGIYGNQLDLIVTFTG